MEQLNGNGDMEPNSQVPVGLGAKSHVTDDEVEALTGVGVTVLA
jgi:hypothetical protein